MNSELQTAKLGKLFALTVNYRLVPRSATSLLAEPSRKKDNILLLEARRKPHNTTRHNKKPFIRNNISPLPNGQFTPKKGLLKDTNFVFMKKVLILQPENKKYNSLKPIAYREILLLKTTYFRERRRV
ncbi:MAG: hypothetical protein IJ998_06510 [Alistipes sp.]|nr:hypothetical protein [Alistipes sp.]